MIHVAPTAVAIENYARVAGAGGSWMEWEESQRRDSEVSAWPPPPSPPDFPSFPEEPWADDSHHHAWEEPRDAGPFEDSPWEEIFHWEEYPEGPPGDACDECGSPPPPIFNLPPPPPMPRVIEGEEEGEGSGCDAPPPSEVCPALLVAGDAHTHQRLHPPLAALVVAGATLTLVFIIAALVCWRYRRQRGRRGPSKSTSDLTNGVIYEDLPSGPTPRVVPAAAHAQTHARDTHTLAPMELLDMKLTSHVHSASYGGAETNTPALLQQYQSPQPLSPAQNSPPYFPKQTYDAHRSSRSSQEIYNPTYEEISTAAADGLSVSSTGSETTSVSSASVSSEGTAASSHHPRERLMTEGPGGPPPLPPPPGVWSEPGSCTCSGKRPSQGRRGGRRKPRATGSATSTGTTEGSEYHEALLPQLVPAMGLKGVSSSSSSSRHPGLPYTIQGTSDGRTSTSSSSDLPVDRGLAPREARYYVGVPPPISRSPSTPDTPGRGVGGGGGGLMQGLHHHFGGDSMEGSSGTSTSTERGLPPLPSRSDRYRIYFTTERRRGAEVVPHTIAARTLDPAAKKRQKRHDAASHRENEPLYHEL